VTREAINTGPNLITQQETEIISGDQNISTLEWHDVDMACCQCVILATLQ